MLEAFFDTPPFNVAEKQNLQARPKDATSTLRGGASGDGKLKLIMKGVGRISQPGSHQDVPDILVTTSNLRKSVPVAHLRVHGLNGTV